MPEKFYTTRFENMKNRVQYLIKHQDRMGGAELAVATVAIAVCEELDKMAAEMDDLEERIRMLEIKK